MSDAQQTPQPDQRARDLLIEHHRLLQAWLTRADRTSLEAFLAAHSPDFRLQTLDGRELELAGLAAELDRAGGVAPELMIEISEVEVLDDAEASLRVLFLERHRTPGSSVARRVDATLRDGRWRQVIESPA
ncbi:nuclear transport factor 2 family protein [Naumannella cuiyingiana]|uniref:DUF4440 domain-containing protein n=1 Tax=Naumannella cuiyingiana TaxID=1347891 RepID=A0A7Z0D7D1_9ACTN|nr:nuclear transport factor 2 family protein [Naumannella cuiyingiana]NYI70242.1 hypothetical protein [Naumannella cuiyingiana]